MSGTPERLYNKLTFVGRCDDVKTAVNRICGDGRIFAVTDKNVKRLHPGILPETDMYVLRAGEGSKTLASARKICRAMVQAGMTRDCTVVAFGGGVVGDLAGFVASVYMRGVNFVNVPTTLLSQVDSAIGGKTGVNLDGYKNMIGSYHMPSDIIICPELLNTLPAREWRCGMGELIKTSLLEKDLFDFVSGHIEQLSHREPSVVETAVKSAAGFKKKITDEDPDEKDKRMILNLGHTVGHALEKCDGHKLSHGEYVMLGLALELRMTACDLEIYGEVMRMLKTAGLPKLPCVPADEVVFAAKSDKKNRADGKIAVSRLFSVGEPYFAKFSEEDFISSYTEAAEELAASEGESNA